MDCSSSRSTSPRAVRASARSTSEAAVPWTESKAAANGGSTSRFTSGERGLRRSSNPRAFASPAGVFTAPPVRTIARTIAGSQARARMAAVTAVTWKRMLTSAELVRVTSRVLSRASSETAATQSRGRRETSSSKRLAATMSSGSRPCSRRTFASSSPGSKGPRLNP